MTQKEMVINWLQTRGEITPLLAQREFGIMRLAACICTLRKEGWKINARHMGVKNRFGKPTWYAAYTLEEGDDGES